MSKINETQLKFRHHFIGPEEFIKALKEGIFVRYEKDSKYFVLIKRLRLFYYSDYGEYCFEDFYGTCIYRLSDYGENWYFYKDAQRLGDEEQ